jgi:PH domain associated with Beige/BEACH
VEQAASLERICVNGHDVLCIILNHLLSELIQKGTIDSLVINTKNVLDTNLLLRESAKMVTEAILAKGSNSSVDASFAVAQWHALRHLVVVVNCVISKCGLGMGDLLNDCMKPANRVDPISGGLYGIRLPEGNSSPINAEKYRKILIQGNDFSDNGKPSNYYRHICVHLSSQILTLIEAFILPKCLDARLSTYQRHGLALVRTNEARLGSSQGPVLASLIRLSLVMICNLEPCSKTFLQCCWRLRCFLQWALELIKESVALAGFSAAFHDLTAPLDRLLLAIVLHSHSALSICATLLSTFEYPFAEGIDDEAGKIKSGRRLIQVCFVLRELVVTAFRGRNEVLRAALSHDVFQALQESLENTTERNLQQQSSQEVVVREFLASEWVSTYHDIRLNDRASDTLQEKQSLESQSRSTRKGSLVMHQLSEESFQNIMDFTRALDVPFKMYLEDQRRWAETDLVRDLEYEGDEAIKRFSLDYKESITESRRRSLERSIGTDGRWNVVVRQVIDLWTSHSAHWKLGENRDCLGRRTVLVRNKAFDKHENASYEQMLGLDRERREMEVEERRRKKAEKEQEELLDVLMKNSAYVPYGSDAMLEDDEVCGVDVAASNQETLKEEIDSSNQVVRPETTKAEELIIEVEPERLEQVFPVGIGDEDQWAKSFVWDDIECIVARFPEVEIVTLRAIAKGKLLLTSHSIYFCPFDSINVVTKKVIDGWHNEEQTKHIASRWRLHRLSEAHSRRYILRAQAIELFFVDGNDLFLHFSLGVRERDRFYAKLRNSCKVSILSYLYFFSIKLNCF